jgi:hypothetical protein
VVVAVGNGWLTYQSTRSKDAIQVSPIDTTRPRDRRATSWSETAKLEVTDFECPARRALSG